jgi:TRAP-type C4-dicarboxylate transport system permease small subunit
MISPPVVHRLLDYVRMLEQFVTCAAFAALATVVFVDVLMREFTGTGLVWAREVGVYANVIVTLVGIGLASDSGSHLRPSFADRWLPDAWDPALVRIGEALTAAFCIGFAFIALKVVLETRALDERSIVLRLWVWPFQAVLPLAFLLCALRHAAYALWPALAPAARKEA